MKKSLMIFSALFLLIGSMFFISAGVNTYVPSTRLDVITGYYNPTPSGDNLICGNLPTPPSKMFNEESAITEPTYQKILTSNGITADYEVSGSPAKCPTLKLKFNIPKVGTTELKVLWKGLAASAGNEAKIYIWNSTSWELVGSRANDFIGEISRTYTDAGKIANLMNNSEVYVLVIYSGPLYADHVAYIYTDYVEVKATSSVTEQGIIKLSSVQNAHAELWNGIYYTTLIKYSDVFGNDYVESPTTLAHPPCNPSNMLVKLSDTTNAHAEIPTSGNYGYGICYGDLICTKRTTACEADEKCVVTISDDTNAHLTLCNNYVSGRISGVPYSRKICCKSAQASNPNFVCESQITKTACWDVTSSNCTWTPVVNATTGNLTTSTADGGHCCGDGGEWIPGLGCDYGTDASLICNKIWSVLDQEPPARKSSAGNNVFDKYCIQIASGGGSVGLYKPVETY